MPDLRDFTTKTLIVIGALNHQMPSTQLTSSLFL